MDLAEEMFFGGSGLLNVALASGREIRADGYFVGGTYRNVQLGHAQASLNAWLLEQLPGRMRRYFGEWPVTIVEPEIRTLPNDIELLPRTEIAALFTSLSPADRASECCFSGLVVVWHQRDPIPVISDRNVALIAGVDWDGLAEDYDP